MTNSTVTAEKPNDSGDIEAVVGTHEYARRLYSPQKAADVMNINLLTGEQPHDIPTASTIEQWIGDVNEESQHKANNTEWHTHTPHVALVAGSGEQLAESGALLSHAAFFHRDITDGMDSHTAYNAAYKSDEYAVTYTPDYGNDHDHGRTCHGSRAMSETTHPTDEIIHELVTVCTVWGRK